MSRHLSAQRTFTSAQVEAAKVDMLAFSLPDMYAEIRARAGEPVQDFIVVLRVEATLDDR